MTERIYRRTDEHPDDVHDAHDDPHNDVEQRDVYTGRHPRDERDATYADGPLTAHAVTSERTTGTRYYDSLPARVNAILGVLLLALEGLLALRFALVAFGASRTSGFVDFIMDLSWPFVRPFSNAFSDRTWDQGIIEVNTLLAMGVYLLGFILLAMLINAIIPKYDEAGERIHRERITHT